MSRVLMTHESMQIDRIRIEGGRGEKAEPFMDVVLEGHKIGLAGKMPDRSPQLPFHELDGCRQNTAYYRRIR